MAVCKHFWANQRSSSQWQGECLIGLNPQHPQAPAGTRSTPSLPLLAARLSFALASAALMMSKPILPEIFSLRRVCTSPDVYLSHNDLLSNFFFLATLPKTGESRARSVQMT